MADCQTDPVTAVQRDAACFQGTTFLDNPITIIYSTQTLMSITAEFPGLIATNLVPGDVIPVVHPATFL